MSGVAPLSPKVQFFSSAGAPLAQGTVDVYLAGTTTRSTTWQDKTQLTANTNPIQLDSRGEALIWVDPDLVYDFVLKNAGGVTQWTVEDIRGTDELLASNIAFVQAGTGMVERTQEKKSRDLLNLRDAAGDAILTDGTQDISAFLSTCVAAAIAGSTASRTIRLPQGTFRLNSTWNPTSTLNYSLIGDGSNRTIIDFYGTGNVLSLALPNELSGITFRSMAAGQSGPIVRRANGAIIRDIQCEDFDGVGFQMGSTATGGCYFCTVDYVQCLNTTRTGTTGFIVDGGGVASSNANTITNLRVGGDDTGGWAKHLSIKGNNNRVVEANMVPNNDALAVTTIVEITGNGNKMLQPYIEPVGTSVPSVYFTVSGAATRILEGYVTSTNGINLGSKIVDTGVNNRIEIDGIGTNFPQSPGADSSLQSLLVNAAFMNVNPVSSLPWGWATNGTGTAVRDNTHVRAGPYSMKLTCTAQVVDLLNFPATATPTAAGKRAYYTIPPEKFIGKTVTVGAWCWSATADFGAIVVRTTASAGKMGHSGSSQWEFLTASRYIDAGTTEIGIALRSNKDGNNSTGECWFTEPILVVGSEVPQSAPPKALNDGEGIMVGRFCHGPWTTFTDADTTPDVSEGNLFLAANTGATTITQFDGARDGQFLYIRPSNGNTTVANNSNIVTTTGANKTLTSGVVYKFVYIASSTDWVELP